MPEKKVLTKEIAEQFLQDECSVELAEFTSIEDAAAESLSNHEEGLVLDGLTQLSGTAASSLSKHKHGLYLEGLASLSDKAAEGLGNIAGNLSLNGLKSLSDNAAESLAKIKGDLSLNGLTSLPDVVAEHLSGHNGHLCLEGLAEINDAVAESLCKHEDIEVYSDVHRLSDDSVESLSKYQGALNLIFLDELSDRAAERLGKHRGYLQLCNITSLSDAAAKSLSEHQGSLRFGSLQNLSLNAAKHLLNHSGELRVPLVDLDAGVREILKKHPTMSKWGRLEGPLINVECSYCGSTDSLDLDAMHDSYETEWSCLETNGWNRGVNEDYFACPECAFAAEQIEQGEASLDTDGSESQRFVVALDGKDFLEHCLQAGGRVEAQSEFDVVLESFGDKKIGVIKEVRALTGLGLKEAKELVDGVPSKVKEGLSKEEADAAKAKLKEAGATVSVK